MAITVCYDDVLGGILYQQLDENQTVTELYRDVIDIENDPTFIKWMNPTDMNADFIGHVNKIKEDFYKLDTLNKLSDRI